MGHTVIVVTCTSRVTKLSGQTVFPFPFRYPDKQKALLNHIHEAVGTGLLHLAVRDSLVLLNNLSVAKKWRLKWGWISSTLLPMRCGITHSIQHQWIHNSVPKTGNTASFSQVHNRKWLCKYLMSMLWFWVSFFAVFTTNNLSTNSQNISIWGSSSV